MKRKRPSKEQVQRWKQKEWERTWDKDLISDILNNIKELFEQDGTIIAPSWEVLGYILGEMRIAYLMHSLIKLQQEKKIILIRKDEDLYLDYIPF